MCLRHLHDFADDDTYAEIVEMLLKDRYIIIQDHILCMMHVSFSERSELTH